jgi:hypothetical protein
MDKVAGNNNQLQSFNILHLLIDCKYIIKKIQLLRHIGGRENKIYHHLYQRDLMHASTAVDRHPIRPGHRATL